MTAIRPEAPIAARTDGTDGTDRREKPGRIISLDWARGSLIVFNLVAISAVWNAWPAFVHASWDEPVPVIDVIFPAFVTLSGAGLAFAYRNQVRWTRTARRTVLLLAAGVAYNACHTYLAEGSVSLETLRYTGPLTMYAVLVPVIAILHRVLRSWPWWALFTVAAATAYTVVLARYAAGCPGGVLTPQCNPSGVIDPLVLGSAHVYGAGAPGHDPEGLIATVGALSSAAAGVTAAHLLLWARRRGAGWAVISLGALAAALWLFGTALGSFVPEFKRLWTPPFGLHVAAGVILVLALGSFVLDRPRTNPRWRAAVWPLVGTGRNALVLYFGSHLLLALLHSRGDMAAGRPWIVGWAETVAVGGAHPQVAFTASFVAAGLVLASTLHRFKLYIRP
jgi:hypothetical protein